MWRLSRYAPNLRRTPIAQQRHWPFLPSALLDVMFALLIIFANTWVVFSKYNRDVTPMSTKLSIGVMIWRTFEMHRAIHFVFDHASLSPRFATAIAATPKTRKRFGPLTGNPKSYIILGLVFFSRL